MKKIIASLLALVMLLTVFVGCSNQENDKKGASIRVAGLKGATTMGLASLLDNNEKGNTKNKYDFQMVVSPTDVAPLIAKGEIDVALVPANLASAIYNSTKGKVQVMAINTLGVTYIVSDNQEIKDIKDLKGKKIYATGKGAVPEYTLMYMLEQNGLNEEDVTIEWKSEPTEVVAIMKQNKGTIAMLPQPFVTVAKAQVEGLEIAINLNEQWEKLDNGSKFITGVLVGRTEFIKENQDAIDIFMEEYQASTKFINENLDEGAKLVTDLKITPNEAVAKKAIPYCNITYIEGSEMRTSLESYLNILFAKNPKSIGGKMPLEDFYYNGKTEK